MQRFSREHIAARSEERRKRMTTHHATGHQDAERWDLEFWQSQGPEARLSALVALHNDVHMVEEARKASP